MGLPMGYTDEAGFAYAGGYGELVDALLEYVPDLLWPLSVRTYARMRQDPQLAGVLAAYTLPIRRASWALDGSGCNPKVTAFISDELDLPILGQEAPPSGARRRGVTWTEHLRLGLLDLTFGFMPFERVYDTSSGMARLGVLSERMPQTIGQIMLADDGSLEAVTQNALAGFATGVAPKIPVKNLVWYAHNREGSAWTGRSLLRSSYAPWLLKHEVWRVHATSIRRFGMGVPSVEAPPGSTPQQVGEAQRLASAMRGGDQAGAGLPAGFKLAITGITGSVPDALGFVNYLDQQMTRSTLTGILDLGNTSYGSRALGDSFMDLFLLSLQSIADDRASQTTNQIVVPLVDLNWGEDEPAPKVICGDVGAQHEVTAQAMYFLLKSGALTADPALDEYIRREFKLPARSTPWVAPPVKESPLSVAKAKPARKVKAAASGGLRRAPTAVEAAAGTDFEAVQGDWESALDTLVTSWAAITAAQRMQLLDQVRAAVDGGDMAALAGLKVDSQAAAAALQTAMEDAASTASEQIAGEAASQGVSVDAADASPDAGRLAGVATTTAALLGAGLASFAARTALQVWSATATAEDVASAVGDGIDSLTDSSLRDGLGGALTAAQSAGRVALLDVAPQATYYSSEILDQATCSSCEAEDGTEFADLAEAQDAYANGGYSECEGGLRCRGIVVAVWDDAATQEAA